MPIAILSIILSILKSSWAFLLIALTIIPVVWAGRGLSNYRLWKLKQELLGTDKKGSFDVDAFVREAKNLNWEAISDERKEGFLESFKKHN